MTNQTKGFHLDLQVRIGALFGDDVRLTTCLDGREVTIRASEMGLNRFQKRSGSSSKRVGSPPNQKRMLSVSGSEQMWRLRRFVPALALIRDRTRSSVRSTEKTGSQRAARNPTRSTDLRLASQSAPMMTSQRLGASGGR